MKISIIMAVHNLENYVKESVESILPCLKYGDVNLLIINDGSTDNTAQVLNQFDKHPHVYTYYIEHVGLGAARNFGVKLCDGEYIMYVDGDDGYNFREFFLLRKYLYEKNPDFVVFKWQSISDKGSDVVSKPFVSNSLEGMWLACWNKCYKRELVSAVLFPEKVLFEDTGYALTAALTAKKPLFLDVTLYNHRHRLQGISRRPQTLKMRLDCLRGFEMLFEAVGDFSEPVKRIVTKTVLKQIYKGIRDSESFDASSMASFLYWLRKHSLIAVAVRVTTRTFANRVKKRFCNLDHKKIAR